jgi:hypothetical protein
MDNLQQIRLEMLSTLLLKLFQFLKLLKILSKIKSKIFNKIPEHQLSVRQNKARVEKSRAYDTFSFRRSSRGSEIELKVLQRVVQIREFRLKATFEENSLLLYERRSCSRVADLDPGNTVF